MAGVSGAPALSDLEGRALWHLQLFHRTEVFQDDEVIAADDDDRDYMGRAACWNCGGEGFTIVCCDDLCHGAGYCFHGDGHAMCSNCQGEGSL